MEFCRSGKVGTLLSCFVDYFKLHKKRPKRTSGFTIQGICPRNVNRLFEIVVISDRSQCCTSNKICTKVTKENKNVCFCF